MSSSPVSAHVRRILPELDEATRPFWTGGADGRLRIAHCGACRRYVHPPKAACPECAGALEYRAVSGDATVFTYTVAHQQFRPDVPTPFVIAVVELAEQDDLRLVTNIVDCEPDAVRSGMAVKVRFEQQDSTFIPVFAPIPALT